MRRGKKSELGATRPGVVSNVERVALHEERRGAAKAGVERE
jgi:hypothetical protein